MEYLKVLIQCINSISETVVNDLDDCRIVKIYNNLLNVKCEMENIIPDDLSNDKLIESINLVKIKLHEISPLNQNPVDCVIWVKNTSVHANDYNPNSVAPPEMELLKTSISEDGYTQPIVTWPSDKIDNMLEVIDGFHRNRVGKECPEIQSRVLGYLPVVKVKNSQTGKNDRIASTIRHNRARGKHNVESMSDIVIELARRNWSDSKIAKNLGMDEDEILRLKQINGIADVFKDADFSMAWVADGDVLSEVECEENLE